MESVANEIYNYINEYYNSPEKAGCVWGRPPTEAMMARVPGLLSGERVLRVRKQSVATIIAPAVRASRRICMWGLIAVAVAKIPIMPKFCFLVMIVLGLHLAITTWWWRFNLLAVTDRRVIIREGWLCRRVKPVRLTQVENATVHQREAWETILDIGSITLEVLAEDDPHFKLIDEPYEFRRLLQKVREGQKRFGKAETPWEKDPLGGMGWA